MTAEPPLSVFKPSLLKIKKSIARQYMSEFGIFQITSPNYKSNYYIYMGTILYHPKYTSKLRFVFDLVTKVQMNILQPTFLL